MKTLWLLSCHINPKMDRLFPFYAQDREQAERQAETILKQHPSYVRLELKEYRGGFKLVYTEMPGVIED